MLCPPKHKDHSPQLPSQAVGIVSDHGTNRASTQPHQAFCLLVPTCTGELLFCWLLPVPRHLIRSVFGPTEHLGESGEHLITSLQ